MALRCCWSVLCLAMSYLAGTTDFLQVETGTTQTVFLNDNITIPCKIPDSPRLDIKIMGITWFWKNQTNETERKVFEFFGDQKMSFRPGAMVSPRRLENGDASLQLSEVQLRDAGEYRCEVTVTPQKAEGSISLRVVALPKSKLFVQKHTVTNNEEKSVVCQGNGFYPSDINITWEKKIPKAPEFQEVTEGITSSLLKSEDGTFNMTSILKMKSSEEDPETIYQCVVWHTSLSTPQRLNITLNWTGFAEDGGIQTDLARNESVKTSSYGNLWIFIFVSIGCILVVPVAFIYLWKWCCGNRRLQDLQGGTLESLKAFLNKEETETEV